MLILELARAGALVGARSKGIVAGLKETIRLGDSVRVISLDGDGQFKASLEEVRRLHPHVEARHVLVGRGERSERARRGARLPGNRTGGHVRGRRPERRARRATELRSTRTPLVASVAYFPERYGSGSSASRWTFSRRKRCRPRCSPGIRSSPPRTSTTSIRTTRWSA